MTRHARVRALAKLNLYLRVLGKRPDGYHELRTIFQTISLADSLEIAFTPARDVSVRVDDALGIPDNLVERAARMTMEAMATGGRIEMRLVKRIPMGAGLGGGSSDAAAVLLALPALAGRHLELPELCRLGERLGSDVSFFLQGGTAVGIGRGSELFPLPDADGGRAGLLVAPGIHVSTPEAYRTLSKRLGPADEKVFAFQGRAWQTAGEFENDFEAVVIEQHPQLATIKRRLRDSGASTAMMTGSGSAVFGLFADRAKATRARERFADYAHYRFGFVSRRRYRAMWWRTLEAHTVGQQWPPRSRYRP